MEQAYDDAKYGRPSANPILECTIPSVVDSAVAPGLCRLPRADQGAVSLRRRDAPRRRGDGRVRLQRGARDSAGREALRKFPARYPPDAGPQWDGAPNSG